MTRRLGLGIVVALDTADPVAEHSGYWHYLTSELRTRATAHSRHGVTFDLENPSFWNFLIPGVGLAPIGAFELLITLFVIGIGPVNYILLRRRHKQSLLMFTVPIGAAVVTGSLLLYAVLADGFTIRARTRCYTEIDQRRGEAACWSRIAYYAGIQPSQGLEFSLDTAVYPIEPLPEFGQYSVTRTRQIDEGTTRRFTSGWLPARTVTQVLTIRARATNARLEIVPTSDGKPPQVTNRLGTRIEQLLVIDEDGKCGWAEAVAADAVAVLDPVVAQLAANRLRDGFNQHQLQFPPSWTGQTSGMFGVRRQRSYYYSGSSRTPRWVISWRTACLTPPSPIRYCRARTWRLSSGRRSSNSGCHGPISRPTITSF